MTATDLTELYQSRCFTVSLAVKNDKMHSAIQEENVHLLQKAESKLLKAIKEDPLQIQNLHDLAKTYNLMSVYGSRYTINGLPYAYSHNRMLIEESNRFCQQVILRGKPEPRLLELYAHNLFLLQDFQKSFRVSKLAIQSTQDTEEQNICFRKMFQYQYVAFSMASTKEDKRNILLEMCSDFENFHQVHPYRALRNSNFFVFESNEDTFQFTRHIQQLRLNENSLMSIPLELISLTKRINVHPFEPLEKIANGMQIKLSWRPYPLMSSVLADFFLQCKKAVSCLKLLDDIYPNCRPTQFLYILFGVHGFSTRYRLNFLYVRNIYPEKWNPTVTVLQTALWGGNMRQLQCLINSYKTRDLDNVDHCYFGHGVPFQNNILPFLHLTQSEYYRKLLILLTNKEAKREINSLDEKERIHKETKYKYYLHRAREHLEQVLFFGKVGPNTNFRGKRMGMFATKHLSMILHCLGTKPHSSITLFPEANPTRRSCLDMVYFQYMVVNRACVKASIIKAQECLKYISVHRTYFAAANLRLRIALMYLQLEEFDTGLQHLKKNERSLPRPFTLQLYIHFLCLALNNQNPGPRQELLLQRLFDALLQTSEYHALQAAQILHWCVHHHRKSVLEACLFGVKKTNTDTQTTAAERRHVFRMASTCVKYKDKPFEPSAINPVIYYD